jgi:hypothetical protein
MNEIIFTFQEFFTFLGLINESCFTFITIKVSNNDKGFKERDTWNDDHKLQVPGNHTKEGQREISSTGRRDHHVRRRK